MKTLTFIIVSLLSITNTVGQWSQKYFVDNFGDPIDKKYIMYSDKYGSFSNSVTSNSELSVNVLIYYSSEEDTIPDFRFDLYEYGDENNQSVGKSIGDATYGLSIKLSDNSSEWYTLNAGESSMNMWFNQNDKISLLNHLKKENKPIKCHLTINGDYNNETYNFKINPIGFNNTFLKIKPKHP